MKHFYESSLISNERYRKSFLLSVQGKTRQTDLCSVCFYPIDLAFVSFDRTSDKLRLLGFQFCNFSASFNCWRLSQKGTAPFEL